MSPRFGTARRPDCLRAPRAHADMSEDRSRSLGRLIPGWRDVPARRAGQRVSRTTSSPPLVLLFGSEAQRDAVAAQARLDELIARAGERRPSTAKVADTVKSTPTTAKTALTGTTAKAFAPKTAEPPAKPGTHAVSRATTADVSISRKTTAASATGAAQKPERPKALPAATPTRAAPDVIVYDVVAGIRTLHRANGTVQEEAFDPATLPAIKAARASGKTQIRIVNETNPVSTGSTTGLQPQSPAAIKAGPR